MDNKKEFEEVLEREEKILDELVKNQKSLRKAVTDKNWESLTKIINNINSVSISWKQMPSAKIFRI